MIGKYFVGIVSASVAVTLISMLYPDDKGGVRRALDLFLSLTLLCVVLAPLGSMLAKARENAELDISEDIADADRSSESVIYAALADAGREQIEQRLEELLHEGFGGRIEVRADVAADSEKVEIKRITIVLYGASMWEDPRALREFVGGYTDAEILIVNGG